MDGSVNRGIERLPAPGAFLERPAVGDPVGVDHSISLASSQDGTGDR